MEGTQKRGGKRREKKKDGKERKRVEKVLERQTRGERERKDRRKNYRIL